MLFSRPCGTANINGGLIPSSELLGYFRLSAVRRTQTGGPFYRPFWAQRQTVTSLREGIKGKDGET